MALYAAPRSLRGRLLPLHLLTILLTLVLAAAFCRSLRAAEMSSAPAAVSVPSPPVGGAAPSNSGLVNFPQGFSSDSLVYNGSAKLAGSALQLTDGQPNEAASAFYPVPQDIRSFVSDFTFQLTNAQADGFTFTMQNVSPNAIGGSGGTLGYAGIPKSVALTFDLFNNGGEGNDSTFIYENGAPPIGAGYGMGPSGIDLHSGHVFHVHLFYVNGQDLAVTITDTQTAGKFSATFGIDLVGQLGSTTAYVGFTGATGALTAQQSILSWTYSPIPYYPQFTTNQGLTLNGGATVLTGPQSLHLIDSGTANEARSAYFSTPVDVTRFTTDFYFQGSNIIGDGFTFVLQNAGLNAVGPSGGGLGYGPDTPWGGIGGGIPQSVAVKFDFFSNVGEGKDSTGLYLDGASPTIPAIDLTGTGVNLTVPDLFAGHLVYDGTTLTVTITDITTGAVASQAYTVNIPGAVGANTAWVGFTAGTGALSASEDILFWEYAPVTP